MLMKYPKLLNLAIYQGIWFTAILGRESTEWVVFTILAMHLILCEDKRAEFKVLFGVSALGVLVDSILTQTGVFVFSPSPEILPIPLWLVGIWMGFAGTLRHSLSYFISRPRLGMAAAGISAPLSYLAGMRLEAVSFGLGLFETMLLIGLIWSHLMGLFLHICGQPEATTKQPSSAISS